jgi:hypothetical protein
MNERTASNLAKRARGDKRWGRVSLVMKPTPGADPVAWCISFIVCKDKSPEKK